MHLCCGTHYPMADAGPGSEHSHCNAQPDLSWMGFHNHDGMYGKYISLTVPTELQASGQMLLAVVSFGIARVVGNLGGGLLADAMGRQNVFFITAGICLLTLCIFAPYYLRRKPLNGRDN